MPPSEDRSGAAGRSRTGNRDRTGPETGTGPEVVGTARANDRPRRDATGLLRGEVACHNSVSHARQPGASVSRRRTGRRSPSRHSCVVNVMVMRYIVILCRLW